MLVDNPQGNLAVRSVNAVTPGATGTALPLANRAVVLVTLPVNVSQSNNFLQDELEAVPVGRAGRLARPGIGIEHELARQVEPPVREGRLDTGQDLRAGPEFPAGR